MSLQGTFIKFSNLWHNCKHISINKNWYNFQPAACLRQTIEEKYNLPTKPKRPLTPYLRFMQQIRPEIKRDKPKAGTIDIMRETAARWEKVDPEFKKNLETEYSKDHAVYSKERLQYDTSLTQEQKQTLKQIKLEKMELKEKRKLKKKSKEMNKPKRPCSAFILYLRTQLPSRESENFTAWVTTISQKWKSMTEADKKPFMEATHKELAEYQRNMVEWERKMIKLGNTDLVRKDALIEPKLKNKPKKTE